MIKNIINPQRRHLTNPKNLRLNTKKTISRLIIEKLMEIKDLGEKNFKEHVGGEKHRENKSTGITLAGERL